MSKHTPGPWHTSPDWHVVWVWRDVKSRRVVADCEPDVTVPRDECRANMHLIAAAPALLAACQAVLAWLTYSGAGDEVALIDQLRAAIRAAEGMP